jgi:hypothetical protein
VKTYDLPDPTEVLALLKRQAYIDGLKDLAEMIRTVPSVELEEYGGCNIDLPRAYRSLPSLLDAASKFVVESLFNGDVMTESFAVDVHDDSIRWVEPVVSVDGGRWSGAWRPILITHRLKTAESEKLPTREFQSSWYRDRKWVKGENGADSAWTTVGIAAYVVKSIGDPVVESIRDWATGLRRRLGVVEAETPNIGVNDQRTDRPTAEELDAQLETLREQVGVELGLPPEDVPVDNETVDRLPVDPF